MRFWWVNQNQTFRQEVPGGYIWSPKRNANGARNPFYETMREVAPGDLIFSFVDTFIKAIGVARSNCYECPKPAEFGTAGRNWEKVGGGWKSRGERSSARSARRSTLKCSNHTCRRFTRRSAQPETASNRYIWRRCRCLWRRCLER